MIPILLELQCISNFCVRTSNSKEYRYRTDPSGSGFAAVPYSNIDFPDSNILVLGYANGNSGTIQEILLKSQ
jgi:hypothetical protein